MTGEQLSRDDFAKAMRSRHLPLLPPVLAASIRTQMHTYFENSTGRVAGPDPSISNVIPIL
jgi:hypothetical protein